MSKKFTYSEIPEDKRWVADTLEEHGFHKYNIHNAGALYNVEDDEGIIQSFYINGTILFHRSNDRRDHAMKSLKDKFPDKTPSECLDVFMWYLERPEEIQKLF